MAEVKTEEKKDWLAPVAITLGVVGVGAGLYFFTKKPPKEVKEGDWAGDGTILSRKTFKVSVIMPAPGTWLPAYAELARLPFQTTITAPVPSDWLPAYAELGRQAFHVTIAEPIVGNVTFSVVGTGFPLATYYWVLYYNPTTGWITDNVGHGVNDIITFFDVPSGGYLGCYCQTLFGVSDFQMSNNFVPENGRAYEYDIASGKVRLVA